MGIDELLTRPTPAERTAAVPGDEVVAPADVVMDRAFTLSAPPELVWPWVVQLGKRRAGWYFPAWFERAVPPSRRGLRRIDPRHQALAVGDVVPDWGGSDATFTVLGLEPTRHLLYGSTRGRTHLTWCLQLTAVAGGHTRMHLRLRLAPVKRQWVAAHLGGLVDQLTVIGLAAGLRERVRATPGRVASGDTPRA